MGSRRAAAYRISARAPTRSPQGGRARQNAAKNPADLHAEGNARGGGERAPASEFHPEPSRGRRRRDGGARKASPRRRPRHAAPAAGPWPKRGRPSPERREAERGSSIAARSAAPRGPGKGGREAAAQRGRPMGGLGRARQRGAGRGGLWGEAGAGGKQGGARPLRITVKHFTCFHEASRSGAAMSRHSGDPRSSRACRYRASS